MEVDVSRIADITFEHLVLEKFHFALIADLCNKGIHISLRLFGIICLLSSHVDYTIGYSPRCSHEITVIIFGASTT